MVDAILLPKKENEKKKLHLEIHPEGDLLSVPRDRVALPQVDHLEALCCPRDLGGIRSAEDASGDRGGLGERQQLPSSFSFSFSFAVGTLELFGDAKLQRRGPEQLPRGLFRLLDLEELCRGGWGQGLDLGED